MGDNQACQSQVHVTVLWCLRVKPKKQGLNRRLKPILLVLGAGSHTLPNHVIGKRMVNTTPGEGSSRSDLAHCKKFSIFSHDSSTPIKLCIIIFDWGRPILPGSIPGDTMVIIFSLCWSPILHHHVQNGLSSISSHVFPISAGFQLTLPQSRAGQAFHSPLFADRFKEDLDPGNCPFF
jgi:hypothetical protein